LYPVTGHAANGAVARPYLLRTEEASMKGATRQLLPLLLAVPVLVLPARGGAQGTQSDYERATSVNERLSPLILGQPSGPEWLGQSSRFWYRVTVDGGNEWRLVDATTAQQGPLFDHARLATSLSAATGGSYSAVTLPFATPAARLTVERDGGSIRFALTGHWWSCTLTEYECTRGDAAPAPRGFGGGQGGADRQGQQTEPRRSPDGKWDALIQNYNVAIRPAVADTPVVERAAGDGTSNSVVMLSHDGSEGNAYVLSSLRWSPDSKKLMAYRRKPGYERIVHYVRSSPTDQLQPRLETTKTLGNPNALYRKPGDVVDTDQPVLFHIETRRQIVIDNRLFPNAYALSAPKWWDDSRAFTFHYNERGHMNFRVIEVDANTGGTRALIDERPQTFFNYDGTLWRHDVGDGREILWRSERDGWKHIWLYDGITGRVKNQVTKGEYVVRGVDSVDVANRHIYFRASSMRKNEDPYLIHYYRINFDGSGLIAYTEANGNHTVSWSPDGRHYVDTWSRVDQPTVMELRRASDRRIVMEVTRADISRLATAGWQQPEPFVAKGRDGTTDIWGVIIRPTNFDPRRKHPVIENIYAGPQGSFVPKTFGLQAGMQSLAELGFIVVQIDGMGTNNRSKAFHDVAWKNLGDAGFPDRILWHKAVAAKYPYYDISRVGIYGTSAGGQNSTGALLFHPEFYDVAVSAVGCHDNRMDKIWWNELWMSWPIGPHYGASSNVDNAHRLQGNLLLVVGELDTNVDPSSSLQVVDALLRANKDVDLLVVPNAGHGPGGAVGTRKRNDYFVRYLLGVEPPRWNALATTAEATNGAEPRDEDLDVQDDWLAPPPSEQPPRTAEWN
jgi:dipeptidyl aminopeptidase/acylaminoacyl peptidase